ncbi:MAG: hypothetical protein C4526_05455 [Nitrospiraceae bacterium]|nr:MAG: hypothetical protein C4526_05455 [Nitrospiraceae bacterium]
MNDTKCPNLVEWLDWVILMCKKMDSPYVPNSTELRAYCKNRSFNKCPHYIKFENILSVKTLDGDVNNYEICHK